MNVAALPVALLNIRDRAAVAIVARWYGELVMR